MQDSNLHFSQFMMKSLRKIDSDKNPETKIQAFDIYIFIFWKTLKHRILIKKKFCNKCHRRKWGQEVKNYEWFPVIFTIFGSWNQISKSASLLTIARVITDEIEFSICDMKYWNKTGLEKHFFQGQFFKMSNSSRPPALMNLIGHVQVSWASLKRSSDPS